MDTLAWSLGLAGAVSLTAGGAAVRILWRNRMDIVDLKAIAKGQDARLAKVERIFEEQTAQNATVIGTLASIEQTVQSLVKDTPAKGSA